MMVPHRTPWLLPKLYPSRLLWRYPGTQRHLYLTFDDGPVNGPTEFVLQTLEKYKCKATFFCIGDNIRKHPEVYQQIVEGGHATGNHTFNHLNGWKTSNDQYVQNVLHCQQYLSEGARAGMLFRPPYGRITYSQINLLKNFRIVMWDVLTQDYAKSLSEDKCLENSIAATRSGSIIVFHDSFKAEKNLMFALPRFIEHFLDSGFEFKVID